MLGYRYAANLDEAVGSFVRAIQDDKTNERPAVATTDELCRPREAQKNDE